jgi:hypothetical protein
MAGIFKAYKGARLDIQLYKSKAVIDFEIYVYMDNDEELDLSIYDDIKYKLFHKIHGTEVLELTMQDGGLQFPSPMSNLILLNISDTEADLRPKEYWQECYGIREDDEQELIFQGIAQLI